jgi:hypothetical protein
VRDSKDIDGFAFLMDRAPDISIDDDQAFILARLKPNFRSFQQDVVSANSQELTWLLIEAVDEFIPVSDRGARLIEADAQRAKAKIGPAIFQNAWHSWTSIQKDIRADCRGRTLAKVMGLGEPNLSLVSDQIADYLNGKISLPNEEKASELRATNAFAWAASFAVFGVLVGEEHKRAQTQELGLGEVIQKLRQDFSVKESILKEKLLREIGEKLSKVIKSRVGIDISILQLVVVFHYADVIASGKEVVLNSLVQDIGEVVMECGPIAGANTAYMIGRAMDDIAVTTLAYAITPLIFPSLIPRQLPCSIDVGNYVVVRQQELADDLINTQLDKGTIFSESGFHQNDSNVTVPLISIEPKDIVEVSAKRDVDIEPLIPSATEDETLSQDAVSKDLILDAAVQDGQSKSQRPAKTSENKKKKDKR